MSVVPVVAPWLGCGRLTVGARVFGVFAVAVLTLTRPTRSAVLILVLLLAVSVTASLAARSLPGRGVLVASTEALASAVLIGALLSDAPLALVYLVVPPLLAGVRAGRAGAAVAWALEVLGLALGTVPTGGMSVAGADARLVAPWLLTSLGSAMLGAWLAQVEARPSRDHDAYHSARRLLAELRTVARSLSAGLDAAGIAAQILVEFSQALGEHAAVVLVRAEGGVLVPLTLDESQRLSSVGSDDPVVAECWTTEAPVMRVVGTGGERRARVALPLQFGVRMIGVVFAECDADVPPATLHRLNERLSEHSLRLDTALVFDEVRTLATADERRRLAREIHDGIAQEVASIGYVVDELIAGSSGEEQRAGLRTLRRELTRLVSELRLSIFDLRSDVSPSAGFGAALTDYVRQVGARSGMTVHLSLNETPQRLRVEVESEILRLAQEAITNARRHSGASNLWVSFTADPPHASLTITDDGHGLGAPRQDSYGLRIMRERADRIGASLDISARPAGGTSVSLTLAPESAPVRAAGRFPVLGKDRADAYVGSAH